MPKSMTYWHRCKGPAFKGSPDPEGWREGQHLASWLETPGNKISPGLSGRENQEQVKKEEKGFAGDGGAEDVSQKGSKKHRGTLLMGIHGGQDVALVALTL